MWGWRGDGFEDIWKVELTGLRKYRVRRREDKDVKASG